MDDVELALQPASGEVTTDVQTVAKKAKHKKNRASNLAQTLNDDAGLTATV